VPIHKSDIGLIKMSGSDKAIGVQRVVCILEVGGDRPADLLEIGLAAGLPGPGFGLGEDREQDGGITWSKHEPCVNLIGVWQKSEP
jgi:hypothetical protein